MNQPDQRSTEYRTRPLSPDADMAHWLELLRAAEQADSGTAQTTEEQMRRALTYPRTQRWVVEASDNPERLIGYGLLFMQIPERGALGIVVHPDWRHRGVGRCLLDQLKAAAREAGAQYIYTEENEQNQMAAGFLRANGFEVAGDVWVLRTPDEVDFPAPHWPTGYTVRSYAEIQDINVVAEACNRGYGDMMGHSENTAGGVSAERLARWIDSWNPHGIWVAFGPDGAPAGTLRAISQDSETEDLIDGPGIAPQHRPHQLQRPLILTAANWLRGQGRRKLRMECWGDTLETVALYQTLGFQVDEHYLSYKLVL